MPWIRRRVVCGLSETIAIFPPASALTSVDLPTFGRPATAMKPDFMRALFRKLPRLGQQLRGRVRDDVTVGVGEDHAVEPKLPEPLPAAAARRRGDPDRLEVAGAAPVGDRT